MIIGSSRLNLLGTVIDMAIKSFSALGEKFGLKPREDPPPAKNFKPKKNYQPPTPKSFPRQATAPYNFVPLPEKILPAPFELKNFCEYITEHGNLSGEILLDITALTPLFIGGKGSKSFAPVNRPIIPGSSLRGMFKNIFKIVTCGAFRGRTTSQKKGEDFNDEHIYFRCLMATKGSPAWMEDLHALYADRMIRSMRDKNKKTRLVKKAQPGFLIRMTDDRFFIAPSQVNDNKKDRILIREYEKKFNVTIPERNSSCVKWDGGTAYIITGSQRRDKLKSEEEYKYLSDNDKKHAGKQYIRMTKIDYVDWCRDHWIALPEDVRLTYEHDRNRNRRGVNLFDDKGSLNRAELERLTGKNLPDVKSLTPCHYLDENGQLTAFGHGQCFRIPYKNRIGDAVPKTLQDEQIVDFADALFGKENFWASRVYFEDATTDVKNFSELQSAEAHPLMQPNPTSYQLYLQQNGEKLTHWDKDDAKIRGYKMYWHWNYNAVDWHASQAEHKLNQERLRKNQEPLIKEIAPLDKGSAFTAKIRFKNLSAVELGALMMIFDLDDAENPAYKIGQGKPFGFGSVKISPTLFIEDDTAYTQLFDDGKKILPNTLTCSKNI